jgi:hypothetical protein
VPTGITSEICETRATADTVYGGTGVYLDDGVQGALLSTTLQKGVSHPDSGNQRRPSSGLRVRVVRPGVLGYIYRDSLSFLQRPGTAGRSYRASGGYSRALRFKSDAEVWKEVLDEVRLRLQLTRGTFETWVRRSSAQRVDGRWETTCVNALAQDWMEHRLGKMIRRELAAVAGERVGEVVFRTR